MQKLLFYSQTGDNLGLYLDTIERKLSVQTTIVKNENALRTRLEEKVFHLFVIDVGALNEKSLSVLQEIREKGFNVPMLIICNEAHPSLLKNVLHMPQVHVMLKPLSEKALLGIAKKLLISKVVPKQLYRRFNTNQMAQVERLASGDALLTSMYNLSKGGAYFEFDAEDKLTVGDVVRLKVSLSDVKAEHTFNAKVVWTTRKGKFSGRFGCGIRFVNSQEIYRMLLSKT